MLNSFKPSYKYKTNSHIIIVFVLTMTKELLWHINLTESGLEDQGQNSVSGKFIAKHTDWTLFKLYF